jgi:hypothetical protein
MFNHVYTGSSRDCFNEVRPRWSTYTEWRLLFGMLRTLGLTSSRLITGDVFWGETPTGALTMTQGLWACESSGEAVRLVSLESVCWKDEFPDDMELESWAPEFDPACTVWLFCIAIVYYKVKPLQRFNILNNQTVQAGSNSGAHDSSSMSSGNSSFQQTDSRLTSLTASPLLSQAQSPCVMVRAPVGVSPQKTSPVINREDVSPSVLNIPNSNRHSVYVDQRGRTSLKQSRELPV